jgi:hypothetical protein
LLRYDAQLAREENQPQVALDDFKLSLQVSRGVGECPTLVAGFVGMGCALVTRVELDNGLEHHTWNDAQLADLQAKLKQIDFLAMYQFSMRSEVVAGAIETLDQLRHRPSLLRTMPGAGDVSPAGPPILLGVIWAGGWWDMNCAKLADFAFRETRCANPSAHVVDPKTNQQLEMEVLRAKLLPGVLAPWTILYAVTAPAYTFTCQKYAQAQVFLDEDRIVCGLERYRLVQGKYPEKLDALAPAYIDVVPHDVMSGEPYHYRLNPDGMFLLYSVGWNQTDEGGKLAYNKYNSKDIDYHEGDMPWPAAK